MRAVHSHRGNRRVALLLLASLACCRATAEEPWTLARESEGIAVYTRDVADSPLKAFRAEVEIGATVARVLEAIGDTDAMTEWLPDTVQCRLLASTGLERTVYVETEAPWPVANRDGVYRFTFEREEGGAATVRVAALPEYAAVREGIVRIPRSDGHWRIEPKGVGVRVAYEIHADPGGHVPAWLANLTVVRMPFKTLRNLRQYVQTHPPPQ
jgi:hypothetical protein